MFQFEEILIAILIGAISVLAWTYVQKKSNGARKSSGQKTRRPKILANVLEEIESRCNYNERIKRAASSSPPNVSEAESILSEMTKNNVAPSTLTYNYLIKAYGFSQKVAEAANVVNRMRQAGVDRNILTYNNLIGAYSKSTSSFEWVDSVMSSITEDGLSPDLVTYNCLLHAYASAKPSRVADAEKLMDHIEKEMNPDNVTYTTLIAAYATAQTAETQKIHDTIKRMKERGLTVDSITYSCLIRSYMSDIANHPEHLDTVFEFL
jgi:pentatricopeptide repeat protein